MVLSILESESDLYTLFIFWTVFGFEIQEFFLPTSHLAHSKLLFGPNKERWIEKSKLDSRANFLSRIFSFLLQHPFSCISFSYLMHFFFSLL